MYDGGFTGGLVTCACEAHRRIEDDLSPPLRSGRPSSTFQGVPFEISADISGKAILLVLARK